MRYPEFFSAKVNSLILPAALVLLCAACKPDVSGKTEAAIPEIAIDSTFDPTRWQLKEGDDYPYRELMYRQLLYSDTLRQRSKSDVLQLLGEPDRSSEDSSHIYYRLKGRQVGPVLFSSKFLVFKFTAADSVEWIKTYN